MGKVPVIDLGECTDCEACLELCPAVFRRNSETGRIEVMELGDYPAEEIEEAIAMCPCDCITWEES
jgi:ferredoxin